MQRVCVALPDVKIEHCSARLVPRSYDGTFGSVKVKEVSACSCTTGAGRSRFSLLLLAKEAFLFFRLKSKVTYFFAAAKQPSEPASRLTRPMPLVLHD